MTADSKTLLDLLPGRAYRLARPYEVSAEKVREFATAVGETDPIFQSAAAAARRGFGGVVAPPTFPIVITFTVLQQLLDDPELAIDLRRVVHGDQRFEVVRPLCAGDVVDCTTTVESTRSLGDSIMVATRSELRSADTKALLVTAHATLIIAAAPGVEAP